jgi:hypothetical protein
MSLAAFACYLAFFAIIYFFDPFVNGFLGMLFFYLSLMLALVGTLSIVGLFVRNLFTKDKLIFRKVVISFRQAIWFSLIIIVSLFLKSADLLIFRNIIFLIFAFALLELFFMSYKSKSSVKI